MAAFDDFVNAILSAEMPRSHNRFCRRCPATRMDSDVFITHIKDSRNYFRIADFGWNQDVPVGTAYLHAPRRVCRDIINHFYLTGMHYGVAIDRNRMHVAEACTDDGRVSRTYVFTVRSTIVRNGINGFIDDIAELWIDWINEIADESFLDYSESELLALQAFVSFRKNVQ